MNTLTMSEEEQGFTALTAHKSEDLSSEMEYHSNPNPTIDGGQQCIGEETELGSELEALMDAATCKQLGDKPASTALAEEETSDETEDSSDESDEAEFIPECEAENQDDIERDDSIADQEEKTTECKSSEPLQNHFSEGHDPSQDHNEDTEANDGGLPPHTEPDEEAAVLLTTCEEHKELEESTNKPQGSSKVAAAAADEELQEDTLGYECQGTEVKGDHEVCEEEVKEDAKGSQTETLEEKVQEEESQTTVEDDSLAAQNSKPSDSEHDLTGRITVISEDSAEDTLASERTAEAQDESNTVSFDIVSCSDNNMVSVASPTESEEPQSVPASSVKDTNSSQMAIEEAGENVEEQSTETVEMILTEDPGLLFAKPVLDPTKSMEDDSNAGQEASPCIFKGGNEKASENIIDELEGEEISCITRQELEQKNKNDIVEEQPNGNVAQEKTIKEHTDSLEDGDKDLDSELKISDRASNGMENEDEQEQEEEFLLESTTEI